MKSLLPASALRTGAVLVLTGLAAAAHATCLAPPPGALAWYPGERHADDLARFHNGALAGSGGYVDGQVGEAFRFAASGDRLSTDVTAAEQRAVRTAFSYELWARPTATLGNCSQSNSSNCASDGLRWAIFPFHGEQGAPPEESGMAAGIGLAIGTDGVCVGEHAPFLVDCLARLATPITDWTHIVAVVEDRVPRIYLNGTLAHTGIASAKSFVFASWEVIGSGLSLGQYLGDLDEVTIYGRALSDAEIAALATAGTDGKCRPACAQRSDDAWQGALVTANSTILSNIPDGAFGATNVSPEADSLLFADNQPDGSVHSIEWRTDSPVALAGFRVFAFHDGANDTRRAFRRFHLQARSIGGTFQTIYDAPVVLTYQPTARELDRCINLRPRQLQEFRAEFTQDGGAAISGPRVVELDGVGLPARIFRDGLEQP